MNTTILGERGASSHIEVLFLLAKLYFFILMKRNKINCDINDIDNINNSHYSRGTVINTNLDIYKIKSSTGSK